MSPEEAVSQAVADARLEGIELDEQFQAQLLLVATGVLEPEVLIGQVLEGKCGICRHRGISHRQGRCWARQGHCDLCTCTQSPV